MLFRGEVYNRYCQIVKTLKTKVQIKSLKSKSKFGLWLKIKKVTTTPMTSKVQFNSPKSKIQIMDGPLSKSKLDFLNLKFKSKKYLNQFQR